MIRRLRGWRILAAAPFLLLTACSSPLSSAAPQSTHSTPAATAPISLVLTAIAPATPTPAPSAASDQMVFASTTGMSSTTSIYLMNADGSGLAQLTQAKAHDMRPVWSPDRHEIAFVSDRSGTNQIYLMYPDGTKVQQLTSESAGASMPTWSPDGKQIAFVAGSGSGAHLATITVDGGKPSQLDVPLQDMASPSWSPDGSNLTISARDAATGDNRDIFVFELKSPQTASTAC
jgi:Tol biopolymer transport system component